MDGVARHERQPSASFRRRMRPRLFGELSEGFRDIPLICDELANIVVSCVPSELIIIALCSSRSTENGNRHQC